MACLGSVTWDYFEYEQEAKDWSYELNRKGIKAKFLGEKNDKFIVQQIAESPYTIMDNMPTPINRKIF
jgi:hypothetical protein